jgi:hypothetical protein
MSYEPIYYKNLEDRPNIFPDDKFYIFRNLASTKEFKIFNNKIIMRPDMNSYYHNFRRYKIYKEIILNLGQYYFIGPFNSVFEAQLYIRDREYKALLTWFKSSKDKIERFKNQEQPSIHDWDRWRTLELEKTYIGNKNKLKKWMEKNYEKHPEYFI